MAFIYNSRGRSNCPRRLFLAVPVGDGKPFTNTTSSLVHTEMALHEAGWAVDICIEANNCHVDDARNSLVREFLKSDCSDLVFVDADVGWREEDLIKLLSYDRDIVAGIYPKKTDETEFPVYLTKGELWAEADGLLEVERVPTGFLRIRRGVLEALDAKAIKFRGNGLAAGERPYPLIFERTVTVADRRRWSGDYSFCNKAKALGYRIFVDPEMHFTHAGINTWTGCLGDHLRQRAGLDHPAFATAIRDIREHGPSAESLLALYAGANNAWAAPPELLCAAYALASKTKGAILEAGSGLSTLILGLAAEKSGATVTSLEHDIEWADQVQRWLDRYAIRRVNLLYAPLRDRDGVRWYETPGQLPAVVFDLVLCDGPPRRFGREGLVKRLGPAIANAALIIDDTGDPRQLRLAQTIADGRDVTTIDVTNAPDRKFSLVAARQAVSKAA